MLALIDGDLVLYRAASAVQGRFYVGYLRVFDLAGEEVGLKPVTCSPRKKDLGDCDVIEFHTMIDEDSYATACDIIDSQMERIYRTVGATHDLTYLTGGDNFRREVYPEYKAHRPPKPLLIEALTKYMVEAHCAYIVEGEEADDQLGIQQCAKGHPASKSIICSYDKDLLMIPGRHYRFDRNEFVTITEEEGMLNFYKQLLTGDRTDNIPGLKGVGPKTAEKILEGSEGERELYEAVFDAYKVKALLDSQHAKDMILRNARLLWIRREENELWSPPV